MTNVMLRPRMIALLSDIVACGRRGMPGLFSSVESDERREGARKLLRAGLIKRGVVPYNDARKHMATSTKAGRETLEGMRRELGPAYVATVLEPAELELLRAMSPAGEAGVRLRRVDLQLLARRMADRLLVERVDGDDAVVFRIRSRGLKLLADAPPSVTTSREAEPDAAAPVVLEPDDALVEHLRHAATQIGTHVVVGAPIVRRLLQLAGEAVPPHLERSSYDVMFDADAAANLLAKIEQKQRETCETQTWRVVFGTGYVETFELRQGNLDGLWQRTGSLAVATPFHGQAFLGGVEAARERARSLWKQDAPVDRVERIDAPALTPVALYALATLWRGKDSGALGKSGVPDEVCWTLRREGYVQTRTGADSHCGGFETTEKGREALRKAGLL